MYINKTIFGINIILAIIIASIIALISHIIHKPEDYTFVERFFILLIPAYLGLSIKKNKRNK